MKFNERIFFDQFDNLHKDGKELSISAVIEGLDVIFDIRKLHQISDGF